MVEWKAHLHYHWNRGHLTNNCFSLKGAIQKLINDGVIEVNNLSNNEDHTAFKNPFMSHEKGESSKANQNTPPHTKVNCVHHYDHTINIISSFDDIVNVIIVKDKNKKKLSNTITQGQASKVILPRPMINPDHAATSSSLPKYNLVNQLLKTLPHISIFELLQISSKHKEILTKALVLNDLDVRIF